MTRRLRAKDLRRQTGSRRERRTLVVFCEGSASEPDYINGLKRLPEVRGNTSIVVEIDPAQGVPLQTGFLTTDEAERRSRHLDGRAGKRIDPDPTSADAPSQRNVRMH